MGYFKDLRKLRKAGRGIMKGWDPEASVAEGMEAVRAAQAVLDQQAVAARLAVEGEPATAQVNLVRETGHSLNQQPIVEVSLLVFREGQPPYPATVQQAVPMTHMSRLTPGSRLAVKVDPRARETVCIDWMAL